MSNPEQIKVPRFNSEDKDMIIGMTIGEAVRSCSGTKHSVVVVKSDGMWQTSATLERTDTDLCVHTENNVIIAIEENDGKYHETPNINRTSVQPSDSSEAGESSETSSN